MGFLAKRSPGSFFDDSAHLVKKKKNNFVSIQALTFAQCSTGWLCFLIKAEWV